MGTMAKLVRGGNVVSYAHHDRGGYLMMARVFALVASVIVALYALAAFILPNLHDTLPITRVVTGLLLTSLGAVPPLPIWFQPVFFGTLGFALLPIFLSVHALRTKTSPARVPYAYLLIAGCGCLTILTLAATLYYATHQ